MRIGSIIIALESVYPVPTIADVENRVKLLI